MPGTIFCPAIVSRFLGDFGGILFRRIKGSGGLQSFSRQLTWFGVKFQDRFLGVTTFCPWGFTDREGHFGVSIIGLIGGRPVSISTRPRRCGGIVFELGVPIPFNHFVFNCL